MTKCEWCQTLYGDEKDCELCGLQSDYEYEPPESYEDDSPFRSSWDY